jgi:hypothetical protein
MISFALLGAGRAQEMASGNNASSSRSDAAPQATTDGEFIAASAGEQPVGPPAPSAGVPAAAKTAATSAAGPSSTDLHLALAKELLVLSKDVDAMQKRIAQIEVELKASESGLSEEGAAGDAAKLSDALKELKTAGASLPSAQAAAASTPAATPAPPDIPAQTTTKGEPFPGDWTWLNDNGHQVDSPMATKYFTPEFRADVNYTIDMNHPEDDTLGGSTETFRSDEWQVEQISIGGDIRIDNVRGRFLCLCGGLWSTTTARNDASVNRGSWDLKGAYQYVAEGWGGYHWDVQHGLNVDAGIFVSYIGLFSYYNFDNWTYQPSFVSSNTPWFFNGLRVQWFPTAKLKIEPWFINGWQSYARPNGKNGLGGQILYRPKPWLDLVFNNYGLGEDDTGYPGRSRVHTDDSVQVKYYDKPKKFLDKMAFSVTGDLGCEYGGGPASFSTADGALNPKGLSPEMGTTDSYNGGVNCHSNANGKPKQAFMGWMMYNRFWFRKDLWAITLGGGQMNNPGRYLTLLPPINAATAVSGSPYYTQNPGDRAQMHDGTVTLDYMPSQFITFRWEAGYRYSDTPYWTGHGGITPPGGDNGAPAQYACADGVPSGYGYSTAGLAAAESYCYHSGNGGTGVNSSAIWWPDLRTNQTVATFALMVRF